MTEISKVEKKNAARGCAEYNFLKESLEIGTENLSKSDIGTLPTRIKKLRRWNINKVWSGWKYLR